MAVSYLDGDSIFSHDAWSAPALSNGNSSFSGVSCTSSNFCAVSQIHGGASFYDSGHWVNANNTLGAEQTSTPISCAGATTTPVFCMEVDGGGKYSYTTDDIHWSPAGLIDTRAGTAAASVSCESSHYCVAGFQGPSHAAVWD